MTEREVHVVLMRPTSEWEAQARAGLESWSAMDPKPATFRELADVDHAVFASIVEAMYALAPLTGVPVNAELVHMAGLRPLEELI